jgi:signal transduction histidine kinase
MVFIKGGLQHALKVLVRRSSVPVELNVRVERPLPEDLKLTVYYIVAEALLNVVKHAHASLAHVDLTADHSTIHLMIQDNGIGGADPATGCGLIGLTDRIEAIGGTLHIGSSKRQGTSLLAEIPTEITANDEP